MMSGSPFIVYFGSARKAPMVLSNTGDVSWPSPRLLARLSCELPHSLGNSELEAKLQREEPRAPKLLRWLGQRLSGFGSAFDNLTRNVFGSVTRPAFGSVKWHDATGRLYCPPMMSRITVSWLASFSSVSRYRGPRLSRKEPKRFEGSSLRSEWNGQ